MMALQVLDVATTYYALTKLDGLRELNGLMAKLIAKLGLKGALALKLAIAGGAVAYLWGRGGDPNAILAAGGICAVYAFIVLNNLKVIRDNR